MATIPHLCNCGCIFHEKLCYGERPQQVVKNMRGLQSTVRNRPLVAEH